MSVNAAMDAKAQEGFKKLLCGKRNPFSDVTVLGTPINGTKMTKDEQIIELQNVVGSLQYDMNNMAKQIEALRELSETHDNALIEIEEVLEMGDDDE